MRLLLINPPSNNRSMPIPLGLAYIAAVAERAGHEVKVIDGSAPFHMMDEEEVIADAKAYAPDLIGMTLVVSYLPRAYRLSKMLSRLGVPLVAGGPHANLMPEEALQNGFDIAVRGEGEETIIDLAKYIEGRRELADIKGIVYKNEAGEIFHNVPRPFLQNLDALPLPARYLFPLNYYLGPGIDSRIYGTILGSRGCPAKCIFCTATGVMGKSFRYRSPSNILNELSSLKDNYDVRYFRFLDDSLTLNRRRAHKLLDAIIASGLRLKWECDTRIDCVDAELLQKMKKAGCVYIIYGVESGDPETLEKIKKGFNLEQVEKGIKLTGDAGICFKVNIIFGFPWEGRAHIDNTLKLIKSIPKSYKCFHSQGVIIPYPATEIYNQYHLEYGFTEWWLKEGAHRRDYDKDRYIPYYELRMSYLNHFYLNHNFFRYGRDLKKYIQKSLNSSGKLGNLRLHGFLKSLLIEVLSRISLFLYKICPPAEKRIFLFLRTNRLVYRGLKRFISFDYLDE